MSPNLPTPALDLALTFPVAGLTISRDFDMDRLIGQDITALNALFGQGVLDREEFRQILVQGEVLPTATESV